MEHFITRQRAKEMIDLYRDQMNSVLDPAHQGKDVLVFSETFDRQAFDTLLVKPETQKLRIYYGMSDDLKIHAIIVGVDTAGRDVIMENMVVNGTNELISTDGEGDDDKNDIIEQGTRCPPLCPDP